jgi:hypothetical protein
MEEKRYRFYRKAVDKFNKNAHPLFHKYFKFDETNAIVPDDAMKNCQYRFAVAPVTGTAGFNCQVLSVANYSDTISESGTLPRKIPYRSHTATCPVHGTVFGDEILDSAVEDMAVGHIVLGLLVSWEFVFEKMESALKGGNDNNNSNNNANQQPQVTGDMMWEKVQERILKVAQQELYEEVVERVERHLGPVFTTIYEFNRLDAFVYHKLHKWCEFKFVLRDKRLCYADDEGGLHLVLDNLSLEQKCKVDGVSVTWGVLDNEYTADVTRRSRHISAIAAKLVDEIREMLNK